MRAATKFLIPSLVTVLVLSACGSGSSATHGTAAAPSRPTGTKLVSTDSNALVKTAANSKLGSTLLVDARGMTLYRLSGEGSPKFICFSAACLNVWHPLIAAGSSPPSGTVGSLGTAWRPGIGEQVTYKGLPLYTFAQDKAAGGGQRPGSERRRRLERHNGQRQSGDRSRSAGPTSKARGRWRRRVRILTARAPGAAGLPSAAPIPAVPSTRPLGGHSCPPVTSV